MLSCCIYHSIYLTLYLFTFVQNASPPTAFIDCVETWTQWSLGSGPLGCSRILDQVIRGHLKVGHYDHRVVPPSRCSGIWGKRSCRGHFMKTLSPLVKLTLLLWSHVTRAQCNTVLPQARPAVTSYHRLTRCRCLNFNPTSTEGSAVLNTQNMQNNTKV